VGLDTSHNCWHGPYSAFNTWRDRIAELAGYGINISEAGTEYVALDWDNITDAQIEGEWSKLPDDPLMILMCHSDCDGRIKSQHCGPLADRIEQVLLKCDLEDDHWVMEKGVQFVEGLRRAANKKENVRFA
jgi:hypothetical protein